MLKIAVACSLALVAALPATLLAAGETDWKPETEESALRFLEESRKAAGEMCRFDVECLRSEASPHFETEERSRLRLYCEPSVGFIFECHPVDGALLQTSRRGRGGQPYHVRSRTSETWLMSGANCTIVDEQRRTYEVAKVDRDDWLLGSLLTDLPQHIVPPLFDPTIDLRSLYRIDQAQSKQLQRNAE